MATSSEKRALLFLVALAALGLGVRAFRSGGRGTAGDQLPLDRQIAAVDSAAARARGGDRKRAAARARRGRGDSISASREDPPSRAARPAPAESDPLELSSRRRREVAEGNRASQERLDALTRVITVTPKAPEAVQNRRVPRDPVDLDTADEATIATVPWIGPSLAARIVRERTQRGTFGSLEGLQRVAGIGPGLASRIASHVRFSGSGMGPTKYFPLRKMRR